MSHPLKHFEPRSVLVVRNDRLGDAVLALPAVVSLRNRFPNAYIIFAVRPEIVPLMRLAEGIDEVWGCRDYSGMGELLKAESVPDAAVCLRVTLPNAWSLWKAGISVRVGTSRRAYSLLFTHRIKLRRRGSLKHEAELNLELLEAWGVPAVRKFPAFRGVRAESELVAGFLRSLKPDQRLVVVHPGSGGSAAEWPPTYFGLLADRLRHRFEAVVAVTGSAIEADKCIAVSRERHFDLCGKTSLLDLAALLQRAWLTVSNSTGPLHLAAALGSKVVGIYPPLRDCGPERWGPYHHPEWAVTPQTEVCRRCRPGKVGGCACLEALLPEQVLSRIEGLFGEGR